MPPIFWVDAGTDAASLRAAFAPYSPGRLPWRPAMYRTARFFVGTEATLDIGIEGLVGWLAQKPLVDGLEWGSAHTDDPWADRVEAGALVIARAAADHSLQAPGVIPSTSVRTALGGFLNRPLEFLSIHRADILLMPGEGFAQLGIVCTVSIEVRTQRHQNDDRSINFRCSREQGINKCHPLLL